MLPLFRKRMTVVLSPSSVAILKKTRDRSLKDCQAMDFDVAKDRDANDWEGAIAGLEEWLAQGKQHVSQVEVILSDRFARYALVPWSDQIQKSSELITLTRLHFESLYGTAVNDWAIHADDGRYGEARVACAIDKALLSLVHEICKKHRLQLRSVKTNFTIAFNYWRQRVRNDSLFCVIEPGNCVLGTFKKGAWNSIRSLRIGANLHTELPKALQRELLLQGLSDQSEISLYGLSKEEIRPLANQGKVCFLENRGSKISRMNTIALLRGWGA